MTSALLAIDPGPQHSALIRWDGAAITIKEYSTNVEILAILRDNPRSLWARLRLGALATRRRRHAEAVAHYRAAVEEVPAFHLAHTLLGSALLRGRRRAEAAASFERARALDPHDPVARSQARRLARPRRAPDSGQTAPPLF